MALAQQGRPARLALDLFSGTGNATAALRSRGWEVITLDLARDGHLELPLHHERPRGRPAPK